MIVEARKCTWRNVGILRGFLLKRAVRGERSGWGFLGEFVALFGELNSAGWKGLESLWSTSWKQSMFYHTFPQGEHLWFLAGSLAETDK